MDYFLCAGFILFLTIVFSRVKVFDAQTKTIYFFLAFCLVFGFIIMRNISLSTTGDAYAYYKLYIFAKGKRFIEYLQSIHYGEITFWYFFWHLSNLNVPYFFVRIAMYGFMYILSFTIASEFSYHNRFCDYIFLASNLLIAYSLLRNCIAYLLIWVAILKYFDGKKTAAYLLSIVAFSIHSSALIILVFWLFDFLYEKIHSIYKTLFITGIASIAGYFFLQLIITDLAFRYYKVRYYYIQQNSSDTTAFPFWTLVSRLIILALLLFWCKGIYKYKSNYRFALIVRLTIFMLVSLIPCIVLSMAYRFIDYFLIVYPLAFSFIRKETEQDFKYHKRKLPFEIVCIDSISLVNFLLVITRSLDGYGIIPLKW